MPHAPLALAAAGWPTANLQVGSSRRSRISSQLRRSRCIEVAFFCPNAFVVLNASFGSYFLGKRAEEVISGQITRDTQGCCAELSWYLKGKLVVKMAYGRILSASPFLANHCSLAAD